MAGRDDHRAAQKRQRVHAPLLPIRSGTRPAQRRYEVSRPEDLIQGNAVVAVQQETTGQFAMEKRGMPKDRLHRFDTLQDALLDTRNGNSVAAVGDLPVLVDMIRKGYPEMEVVPGKPFVEENLGIVARRDSRDLVAAINTA
jgi:ABC-type amino acid transport substrate-binding protein